MSGSKITDRKRIENIEKYRNLPLFNPFNSRWSFDLTTANSPWFETFREALDYHIELCGARERRERGEEKRRRKWANEDVRREAELARVSSDEDYTEYEE